MLSILRAFCIFLALTGFSQADMASEYQNCTRLDGEIESPIYTMCWTFNSNEMTMSFAVKAKTTGWVGFGFANKIGGMTGYDVVVGFFDDFMSKVVFNDFHTTGYGPATNDTQQDLMNKVVSESNGYTTIKFKRKLDTKDQNDIVIKEGPMIVVWSYSNNDALNSKHADKGYKTVTLIPVKRENNSTPTGTVKPSYTTATLIPVKRENNSTPTGTVKPSYTTATLIPVKSNDSTTPTGTVKPVTVGAGVFHVSWVMLALYVVFLVASGNIL